MKVEHLLETREEWEDPITDISDDEDLSALVEFGHDVRLMFKAGARVARRMSQYEPKFRILDIWDLLDDAGYDHGEGKAFSLIVGLDSDADAEARTLFKEAIRSAMKRFEPTLPSQQQVHWKDILDEIWEPVHSSGNTTEPRHTITFYCPITTSHFTGWVGQSAEAAISAFEEGWNEAE